MSKMKGQSTGAVVAILLILLVLFAFVFGFFDIKGFLNYIFSLIGM